MKKILAVLLTLALSLAALSACGGGETPPADENQPEAGIVVKVAATPAPHAEILEAAKELMAAEGYTLEIVEFSDYIIPNEVTSSGEVDANYFQHLAYLNDYNHKNGTALVPVAAIHYEPYALYAGKTASLDELAEGAQISVPSDPSNEARALLLLEEIGLITLTEGVGLEATKLDIVDNPLNLNIQEMEAAQLARTLDSVDMAVINGNYAIQANLNVATDAVAVEDPKGENTQSLYANVLVVQEGNEENPGIAALLKVLQSDAMREFITTQYGDAVVPLL